MRKETKQETSIQDKTGAKMCFKKICTEHIHNNMRMSKTTEEYSYQMLKNSDNKHHRPRGGKQTLASEIKRMSLLYRQQGQP